MFVHHFEICMKVIFLRVHYKQLDLVDRMDFKSFCFISIISKINVLKLYNYVSYRMFLSINEMYYNNF